ncbi:hypothetical protein DMN91_012781 [Ooceraea biroi]|uniref:Uncharacterized protein n=1 Tax=Ooceraea biroi TaxID=2015173 RepID=A0A3L8D3U3_OOCBI|nr:hypothetical protein DMN91_012781 [Ooceraea biroi]
MPRRASAITSRCQPWERTRSRRYALAHCQLHLRERRIHYPAPPWITLRGCPCTTNPRQTRPTHTDSRNDRLINGRAVSTSETNTIMATNNAASSNTKEGNVEAEIARGEQDDVLEDYSKSTKAKLQEKPRSKALASKIVKRDVSQTAPKSGSARIKELARPTRQRVLMTLQERASTLSPVFVDNLIKIIEAESCLTPEEAAQVLREKRRSQKATRAPVSVKKWERKIAKLDGTEATSTLEKDATMCQYLIAECFVRSILGYQCQSQKKDVREIAQVILKRLTSLDGYTDTRSDDRATQQLRLLADIVACWIAEVLMEVAETRKEALEEYREKRRMKMMEADDDDDQTDSKPNSKQTERQEVANETAQEAKNWIKRENSPLNEREIKDEEINKIDEREDKENEGYRVKIEEE